MFSLSDYIYDLPEDRIAQEPIDQRDNSRLLVLDRLTGGISHCVFSDICNLLRPSDILVINDTEVVPGRLQGRKETGGKAEVLILDYYRKNDGRLVFDCLVKTAKRSKLGTTLYFDQGVTARVIGFADGIYTLEFSCNGDFEQILYQIGQVPLPPYIRRNLGSSYDDRHSYQTIYALKKGAIAAPTAGFHFTDSLMENLKAKGIKIVAITLHVGYGTFLPVRVSDIRYHKMHAEHYDISQETAEIINRAKESGRRIAAVGTTCVRTLEYAADEAGKVTESKGVCDLFIYPGYRFKVVDAMITNFHLPASTLLMLVSAFAGRENILKAYKEAIEKGYRFYSYGDAMLISGQ